MTHRERMQDGGAPEMRGPTQRFVSKVAAPPVADIGNNRFPSTDGNEYV